VASARKPLRIVAPWKVLPEMRTPAFGTRQRAVGDAQRQLEHLLHPVRRNEFDWRRARCAADIAAAKQERLQFLTAGANPRRRERCRLFDVMRSCIRPRIVLASSLPRCRR
jgi:hypothetical protein